MKSLRRITSTAPACHRRFRPGSSAILGMVLRGAEKKFAAAGSARLRRYAAGLTPNPTYREVCSGMTATTVVLMFDPKKISRPLLKTFWENHDPTQGMRQGNDTHAIPVGYLRVRRRPARRRLITRHVSGAVVEARWRHHHRDPAGAGVLLRRGPPAIPVEES